LERWCGDQSFRTLLDEDPRSAVATYNLDVDPEEVRVLWDSEFAIEHNRRHGNVSAAVQRYRDFNSDKVKWRRQVREECEPSNVRFKEWRRREMTRCLSQFGDLVHDRLIYSPLCIEISDGCSVGCKFCAFSAKPLKSNFKYTKENTAEWRELLKALREIIGPAARWGTCYFATEPLDNPDYEKFCMDFHSVMGMFPQTTTAVPIRNIERTRKLLEIARANGCRVDRFSILTLDTLAKVHEAFSPEELTNVELIVQNPESILNKSIAGRLRTAIVENPDIARQEIKKIMRKNEPVDESRINELPKTISCL
jgi:radical SAM family RiPP maturation amino acid epimerase